MRTRISNALKDAMRGGEAVRVSTLRLMLAALKDREIALRGDDGQEGLSDADALVLLARMVKQREESIATYEQAARMELADRERREVEIIQEFLPKPLSADEVEAAVSEAIAAAGAQSIRDMGKVMAALKRDFTGRMDFAAASSRVKAALG
ncbi:MAG: GatB/YqeY domain-containing protein [Pseudomonadota bacterium]